MRAALLALVVLAAACSGQDATAERSAASPAGGAPSSAAPTTGAPDPVEIARRDVVSYGEDVIDDEIRPQEPLEINGTEHAFVDDAVDAYGLALAWQVTGDRAYAERSVATIDAWVRTTRTTSGTCPDSGECQTSLIISRMAPALVFAAQVLEPSGAMSDAARQDFHRWLREVILPTASERTNNWGDAGTFMRVVVTDELGDDEGFAAALDSWRSMLDLVEADGAIPEETRRGRHGVTYTQEALTYKVAVAELAERRGVDLWDHVGARGGTLRAAVDLLARAMTDPASWPFHDDPEVPRPGPMWELAFAHWRSCDWVPLLDAGRPFGELGNSGLRWTTLTHGVPVPPSCT